MAIHIPLGIDNFQKLRQEHYYYIDKTLFIRKLLSQRFEVNLITRPRRFGKTLTMSTLEAFFDIRRDSRNIFSGLDICQDVELCDQWMNQWPTIFLTLKNVEGDQFCDAYERFRILMADLCKRYSFLENSELVDSDDVKVFQKIKANEGSNVEAAETLYLMTRMLYMYYGKPVILLIDEYDVPLSKASECGYYPQMLDIIRAMLGKVLKTNEFLKFAVITGCLKIAKDSIFTGTNNFISDTITGVRFDEFIGFTQSNVDQILRDTRLSGHRQQIKEWYNGYRFGNVDVYCPWDVLNYVTALQMDSLAQPESYWENTSHNGILRKFIERRDLWREENINEDFETLLDGGCIFKPVTENLTYDMIHASADHLWSLLYMTGYLTRVQTDREPSESGRRLALKIPNEEIHQLFKKTVASWFEDKVKCTDRAALFEALWSQRGDEVSKILSEQLFETISYHDYKEEFYHAFLTGILSFAGYKIKSNSEKGEGRPDLVLTDEQHGRAIIFELKRTKEFSKMDQLCGEALVQIERMGYARAFGDEYEEVLAYGVCFFRKRCRVRIKKCR